MIGIRELGSAHGCGNLVLFENTAGAGECETAVEADGDGIVACKAAVRRPVLVHLGPGLPNNLRISRNGLIFYEIDRGKFEFDLPEIDQRERSVGTRHDHYAPGR